MSARRMVSMLLVALLPVWAASYKDLMEEGNRLRAAGDVDAAIRSYRLAAGGTLDLGQSARAWYRIGQVLEDRKEWSGAAQSYSESLRRKRYPETEEALGRIEGLKVGRVVSASEIVRSLTQASTRSQVVCPSVNLFVNFDTDKDTLKTDGMAQVAEMAKALADPEMSSARFLFVGHTDRRGSDEHNQDLSVRRARRVRETMVSQFHVPAAQCEIEGMGKRQLLSTAETDDADRLNRRVEVRLLTGDANCQ